MTHYSDNPGMVRVDFFKPSGKWYMTEAHDMSGYYDSPEAHLGIERMLSVSRDGRPYWWRQFTVVVSEPHHKNAHPQMIVSGEIE